MEMKIPEQWSAFNIFHIEKYRTKVLLSIICIYDELFRSRKTIYKSYIRFDNRICFPFAIMGTVFLELELVQTLNISWQCCYQHILSTKHDQACFWINLNFHNFMQGVLKVGKLDFNVRFYIFYSSDFDITDSNQDWV